MASSASVDSNSVKAPFKPDQWLFRFSDQISAIVRHYQAPSGRDPIKNFILFLRHLTKSDVPFPLATFHVSERRATADDLRYVFSSIEDCELFVKALDRVNFATIRVESVLYTDAISSSAQGDNASVKIRMSQCATTGEKTTAVISRSDNEGRANCVFKISDPYKTMLEDARARDTRAGTPIDGPLTPMKPWGSKDDEEKNEGSASKKMKKIDSNGGSSSSIPDTTMKVMGAAKGIPVIQLEDEATHAEPDFPPTRDDAVIRVAALKDSIISLTIENYKNPNSDTIKRREKLKADKLRLEDAIEFFDAEGEANGMEWRDIEKIENKM